MKKIKLLFLIAGLLVVLSSVSYARIIKKVDNFSGVASITSIFENIGPFRFIYFDKIGTLTFLQMTQIGKNWQVSKELPLEMKINGKIYYLLVNCPNWEKSNPNVWCNSGAWDIDEKIAKRILEANSITIRVHSRYGSSTILTIPSKVLKEWKRVIRMKF